MKEVQVTMFLAFDGQKFATAQQCRDYETESIHRRLVGLTEEQVINALNRDDADLADVLEQVGMKIRRERQKSRELRRPARTAKPSGTAPEPIMEGEEAHA